MKREITTETHPIRLWLDYLEDGALKQAKNLANLPFVFKHIAIMPDSHQGYGMPIGGVMATKGVVIPNAVGVDIGCGMLAVKTSVTQDLDNLTLKRIIGGSKEFKGGIRSTIPVGFNHQSKKQRETLMPSSNPDTERYPIVSAEYTNALKQLGTLGGGNHFIEIQRGSDGFVWLMVHSGSRNIGYKVANAYNEVAVQMADHQEHNIPKGFQLAYLDIDSDEGRNYMREMGYCVEFAKSNRVLMMENVKKSLEAVVGEVKYATEINIAHNYASEELHYGEEVIVHRKGATSANVGELGIIPGNQGAKSYIVKGLGNPDSFMSCSHGAGRKMGRGQARRNLDLDEELTKLEVIGVVHSVRQKNDLDEAPGAYKDINEVMSNQMDLVEVVVELVPLAVIKG